MVPLSSVFWFRPIIPTLTLPRALRRHLLSSLPFKQLELRHYHRYAHDLEEMQLINASFEIINACLLTSAWSAASSYLFTGSRAICKVSFYLQFGDIYLYISVKTVWRFPAMHPEYSLKLCRMDCLSLLFYLTRALLSSVTWVSRKVLA